MLENLNPLVVLLLGIIIGWLLEWFFDLWFFRRARLEAERRLVTVEAERASWESRARAAEPRASQLEQQLAQATAALAAAEATARIEAPVIVTDAVIEAEAVAPVVVVEETDLVPEVAAETLEAVVVEEIGDIESEVSPDGGPIVFVEEPVQEAEPVLTDVWPPDHRHELPVEAEAEAARAETEVKLVPAIASGNGVDVTSVERHAWTPAEPDAPAQKTAGEDGEEK